MSALVTFVLVDGAVAVVSTTVAFALTHGASKKAFASVATGGSIMFARGSVTANGTNVIGGDLVASLQVSHGRSGRRGHQIFMSRIEDGRHQSAGLHFQGLCAGTDDVAHLV